MSDQQQYQCVQFGVCPRADRGECFHVDANFKCGRDPEDPDCREKLEPVSGGGASGAKWLKIAIPVVAIAALVGGGIYFLSGDEPEPTKLPEQKPSVDSLLIEVWPDLK
jgi:hypothetical protein